MWLAGSGCAWNLWVWLVDVVVRRYIDFLILLIPTPLVSVLFCSSIPTFCLFKKMFFVYIYIYVSGRTLCRKCSKCFYMYLNIFPMRYSAMQI